MSRHLGETVPKTSTTPTESPASAMPSAPSAPTAWDPQQYLRYADERARPFHELLARVPARSVRRVADLGCGPGGLTRELARRWPEATVVGVDSSAEMVARAARYAEPGRLEFVVGDLREWQPAEPVDVLVSNATLQWVPGHLDLLPRLLDAVAADGWLALQVPGNFDQPTHRLLDDLREDPRWRATVRGTDRPAAHDAATYARRLRGLGCRVDAWETTYLHVLAGPDAVLEWVKGTAARPVLSALPAEEREPFLAAYAERLREAYRPEPDGSVTMPFRRVFAVASRAAAVPE